MYLERHIMDIGDFLVMTIYTASLAGLAQRKLNQPQKVLFLACCSASSLRYPEIKNEQGVRGQHLNGSHTSALGNAVGLMITLLLLTLLPITGNACLAGSEGCRWHQDHSPNLSSSGIPSYEMTCKD